MLPPELSTLLVASLAVCLAVCFTWSAAPILRTHELGHGHGVPYSLPRSVLKLTVVVSRDVPTRGIRIDVQGTIEVIPDPDHSYLLVHDQRASRADEVKVTTDGNGLLTAITTHSVDQTLEIAKTVVSTATGLLHPAAAAVGHEALRTKSEADDALLEALVGTHEVILELPRPGAKEPRTPLGEVLPVDLFVRSLGRTEPVGSGEPPELPCDGVLVRPRRPHLVEVRMRVRGNENPVARMQLLAQLPDDSPFVVLRFDRTPFVKTSIDCRFERGALTQFDVTRPSSALAFVRAPLDTLREALKVPAELIQLKFDVTSKQKKLVDAERALRSAIDASSPDPATAARSRRIAQFGLQVQYETALGTAQLAKESYEAAIEKDEGISRALSAYRVAATRANQAAFSANLAEPYDLATLPNFP